MALYSRVGGTFRDRRWNGASGEARTYLSWQGQICRRHPMEEKYLRRSSRHRPTHTVKQAETAGMTC